MIVRSLARPRFFVQPFDGAKISPARCSLRVHSSWASQAPTDCAQHLPDANLVTDCVLEKLYDSWPETIRSDGPGNPIGLHARDMHY